MDHKNEKATTAQGTRGLIALLLAIAVIGLALTFVFARGFHPAAPAQPDVTADPAPQADLPEERQAIAVDTPVGSFVYPEEWGALVTTEDASTEGTYGISFFGEAGGEQVPLFTLAVGPDGQGYLLGTAPDVSGAQQEIRLDIRALEQDPGWTDEEFLQLNTEQACVNDLIEQIHELDGFLPAE